MSALHILSILGLLGFANGLPSLGTTQSAAVRALDPDDLLDSGVTDDEGRFELKGHETELTPIDPKLNVYHDCNDESVPCLKKFSIYIPKDFITEGQVPKKTFDAGVLNLSGRFSGESRDCIN
ncbi:CRE-TTR-6 protein [Aphelenchoides avenae]|nr:CRE-TTR-6 protein [Aphelenchus avenae]